jgi:phosphatidylserine/phosphatidylglycerophosphate/cardiolipin synthase-like enzyme
MPTLDELKNKWFLDFNASGTSFPPVKRFSGSTLSSYTDGNKVTPLIDGANYMKTWHDLVRDITYAQSNRREIYHAAFIMSAVATLGHTHPDTDAEDLLLKAHNAGVAVYPLMCANIQGGNRTNLVKLSAGGLSNACIDERYPPAGSNHQKFTCFKTDTVAKAMLGSIDLNYSRWDTEQHLTHNPDRHPIYAPSPSHDLGVLLEGPAVADVEKTFIERWNDSSRSLGLYTASVLGITPYVPLPLINTPVSSPAAAGTHSVQVLRTYGRTAFPGHYSWAGEGEFTIWASYLNAIKKAQKYIYIEDQYLLPFDWPPCYERVPAPGQTGAARESDIIYQLAKALQRGVDVIAVIPDGSEDFVSDNSLFQRNTGLHYLATQAITAPGRFIAAYPNNGEVDIYIHSKVMICDDEFALIGSANINQRSMTNDSELHIGVVDSNNQFARDLRMQLWAEHMWVEPAGLENYDTAYNLFVQYLDYKDGRLKYSSTKYPGPDPLTQQKMMRNIVDPYSGPERE